jgi:hypothetical protein
MARDDDPYSFGSAFEDDAFDDEAAERSIYSNPFTSAPDTAVALGGADTADAAPAFDFSGDSGGGAPSLDVARLGRISPGTLAPALGMYGGGGGAVAGRTPGLDYVFAEDYKAARKKGGGEQLTYLAGGSYLAGAAAGGAVGLASAVRVSAGKTGKLRLNAVLNATGKRGALAANSMGVLALTFSLSETALHNITKEDSVANYAAAGAAAGALFKSTRGLRTAGIWAAGGAAVAVGAIYASREGVYGRRLQGIL